MRWKRGNRLKLISEEAAPARSRELLAKVKLCLGVPTVPVLYQVYASFPKFLELHWERFAPVLESQQFFLGGARLAAECYTRVHNYFNVPEFQEDAGAAANGNPLPLSQVLDYYQYLDPLLLLISVAQMLAFEAPAGLENLRPESPRHPDFPLAPRLVPDDKAPALVQHIWEERRRMLRVVFVSDEHRALANWPNFYRDLWRALKAELQSPIYEDCQHRVVESAWGLVRELPGRIETGITQLLEAGMTAEDVASLVRINESLVTAISGLLLDISFARIGCDGGTHSRDSASPIDHSTLSPPPRPRRRTSSHAA